jgi:hypothetical protein
MAATNKRLLISESRGDSNRCTPYRGKPNQHDTYASSGRFPYMVTFHTIVNRFEQIYCTREEGLPTQSTARRPSDPLVWTQLLSHNSQWSSGEKSSFCWQPTTRLTGPILPACDRYVQYLLTGTNPSVLNRNRRGLPHRKTWNSHNTLLALPFRGFHWSP